MSQYADHSFSPDAKNDSWSVIFSYINSSMRVLDVGCSTGELGAALQDLKQCEVVGIDPAVEDIAVAKKKLTQAFPVTIEEADPGQLGEFNAVIFADVLEHLTDPVQALRTVKEKLLKKDGIVCFSIPNMAHISVRLDLLQGRFPYRDTGLLDKTHLHFYDPDEVERIFREAGYVLQSLNPVTIGYPRRMLEEKLHVVGLEITDGFLISLEKTKANIFQIAGCATVSSKSDDISATTPEYVMPQDEVKQYADALIGENERLWRKEEELRIELEQIKQLPLRYAVSQELNRIRKKIRGSNGKG